MQEVCIRYLHLAAYHKCKEFKNISEAHSYLIHRPPRGPKLPIATAGRLTTQLNAITRIFTALTRQAYRARTLRWSPGCVNGAGKARQKR